MGALLNLAGSAGFNLIMFIVLFILITLAVIWILDRMASINRSFGILRVYSRLPPCRDKLGRVQLGQLAENIDRLADHLKEHRRTGLGGAPETRLADDLAELAKCARTMQAFLDRNASALINALPLVIGQSVKQQRLLSAPPVQPENDWPPNKYRAHGAEKATASEPQW